MGLSSPQRLKQVKQIKLSQLLSEIRNFLEIGQPPQNKPREKNNCKPATIAPEKN
jgi:hypothetical protein